MESYDFPIQHFEMMHKLAARLKVESILIMEHNYNYEVFGSWWFTFNRKGERYRMIYDSRDSCFRLKQNIRHSLKYRWEEIREEACADKSETGIVDAVLLMINRK